MHVAMNIARRRLLVGAGTVLALAGGRASSTLAALATTPRQTTGPFYPVELPLDRDNDLVRFGGAAQQAQGQITHVFGRVLDRDARPIRGARIEIWQCNAFGRYHHPRDTRDAPLDPGFQGYGETVSAADGAYRFRTIRPVPYPGRTPHIHFAVTAPGMERLVTQMYVAGEPGNARDGLYNSIRDPAARAALTVALAPAAELESGAIGGTFDIILGG
jgi:protocatechuate 3,4-dioxygenase beta subunit